ncbi:MAG: 4-alpha-glucanotransferase [Shewanella sp.]|jgi:4-alpha-glucanotransferase
MGLEQLLYLQGVGARFVNCDGQEIEIPFSDRKGLLQCMLDGEDPSVCSSQFIDERAHLLDAKPWTDVLHTFQHTSENVPSVSMYLRSEHSGSIRLVINTESGESYAATLYTKDLNILGDYRINDILYLHYQAPLKNILPRDKSCVGYHQVELTLAGQSTSYVGTLMISPNQAYQIDDIKQQSRTGTTAPWGVSVQLYSLRSDQQWGIGDFGDLKYLIAIIAEEGGDFIQLNPLHALDNFNSEQISPYSPSDRRRLNPLYIDIASVEEYRYIESQLGTQTFVDKKIMLNQDDWINYDSAVILKYELFTLLYDAFCTYEQGTNSLRDQAFSSFVDTQGDDLTHFAAEFASKAGKDFVTDPHFYCYLQFVAETQLKECQRIAKSLGMTVGLIRDLAVGASPDGVEVKQNSNQFCLDASIGAPPDSFAPQGQNWGLTPFDPVKQKQNNFQHFINIVRRNMQACGALRIDHVMGMLRLWWLPNDSSLGKGGYVYYPVDTLFAILCLESHRAQCCIIGEDLGVVPPEINRYLTQTGIYSNQLFYFCKTHERFTNPSEHRPHSLMMLANHDVPPLAAWWSVSDIYLRRQLELLASDDVFNQALNERESDKRMLVTLLIEHGFIDEGTSVENLTYETLLPAWISLASQSRSSLFSVQFCDLIGEEYSVNIPGTWQEYANWQRRLPLSLADINDSLQVKQLLKKICSARSRPKVYV